MIKVTFGEHDRCNDTRRPETRFVLRANAGQFSFLNFDNDIAILRLNDRVPITSTIKPICLPKKTGKYSKTSNDPKKDPRQVELFRSYFDPKSIFF